MPSFAASQTTAVPRKRFLTRIGTVFENEQVLGYLVIAPALLLLLVLVAYPFFIAIGLSLQNKVIGKPGTFVGLKNFWTLLDSQIFRQTLQNSFVFTFSSVTLKVVFGMILALLLNRSIRGQKFFRGAILLPWIVPTALSTLAFLWIFDATYSIINWVLLRLGIIKQGILWLGKPHWAMLSVIIVNTWRGMPFFAISILAGLVSIPQELYEAAKTDGAGPLTQFWYITLPLLKPVLMIVILFSTIFTFSDFNIVYVLTRGGPTNSTHLFATYAYQTGLVTARIGEGAAISLFLFPVLVVVVFFQLRLLRREEY
ncbi:MAG: sugar ABC transporter permease [Nitrospinota bacterium]|nr:MAG: sugar ABC transporter permease [Nitrospinota bacterium]